MVWVNSIEIAPPLLNSSCAWSSDLQQLTELYLSPHVGAVTTRTATLNGFREDSSHKVAFSSTSFSTINSYGYSPYPLSDYISWVELLLQSHPSSQKPIIISITASDVPSLTAMVQSIQSLRHKSPQFSGRIAIELNTSCPNIPDSPPSGYSFPQLLPLLVSLADAFRLDQTLTMGLKLPPFVHQDQFKSVFEGLRNLTVPGNGTCPFAFLTCTNTLGNSLLFEENENEIGSFALQTALGGLGGESLHPLALGNVYSFKQLLSSDEAKKASLDGIKLIGVGGVTSRAAAARMRSAGADVVGCATFFGKEGVRAFELLAKDGSESMPLLDK